MWKRSTDWTLFWLFAKVGTFTIGGGYVMLPVMERELVDRHHLISHEDFWDSVALAQTVPGLLAINVSIYTGYKVHGFKGALVSALGTALPSFLIILLVAMFFSVYKDHPVVERIFKGIRPVVVALILIPVCRLAQMEKVNWRNAALPLAVLVLIYFWGVSPLYLIFLGGFGAYFWYVWKQRKHKDPAA